MTVEHQEDLILRTLARMPRIKQDPARAERTRARCRGFLQPHARAVRRREATLRRLAPALAGGFSLAYLAAMFGHLLRWKGVL